MRNLLGLPKRRRSREQAKTQGPTPLQIVQAKKWNTGLAAIATLLSIPAFISAFAQLHDRSAPELALRVAPRNSVALASQGERIIGSRLPDLRSDPQALRKEVERLAIRALHSNEFNPRAVRLLAYTAMMSGDYKRGNQLTDLALRLTRRDVWVYLLRIEEAVRRDDLADVLRNYDRAMTVGARAGEMLSPILVNGLSDHAVRIALVPYVVRNPAWMNPFLLYAVGNTTDPQYIADLIVRAGGLPSGAGSDEIRGALMPLLFDTAHFSALGRLLVAVHGDPMVLTMTDFSDRNTDGRFAPFTWQPLRTSDVAAEWDGEGEHRRLSVSIGAGKRAVAARKLLSLKPGSYELLYRFTPVEGDATAEAVWSLYCRREGEGEGRLIWQSTSLPGVQTNLRKGRATIPGSCILQELRLTIAGGESEYGMEALADSIVVRQVK